MAVALAAVPFAGAAPAQASCGNLRSTAAGAATTVQQVALAAAADPSPTPCPSIGPLGPTSDDDGGGPGHAKAATAVAAVVLIVGGLVLRRRAGRH